MLENKCITIENLEVLACHGCNPEEKIYPQPFRFDLKIFLNYEEACFNDNIDSTVSFTKVGKIIRDFCTTTCFDLVEKLASEICRVLMDEFPAIDKIQIEVKKLKPPTRLPISSLGVSLTLKREIVYLSLGSNIGEKDKFLTHSIFHLGLFRGIKILQVSKFLTSEPYGGLSTKNLFLNGAVKISTYLEPEELLENIHAIEIFAGRLREGKWGEDRTLDIDIVFFGRKRIFTKNLRIPHYDWKNRDFVKTPIAELDPFILEGWD